jgi:hypothetical protein
MQRWILLSALTFAAMCAHGCESRSFTVTGKVTYNGAVLDKPDGQVVFVGPNGKQTSAQIGPDGSYRAAKVEVGLNRVAAYYPNPSAKRGKTLPSKPIPAETPVAPNEQPEPVFLTPYKYVSPDTSDLSISVEKDAVFDIDLTGPSIP